MTKAFRTTIISAIILSAGLSAYGKGKAIESPVDFANPLVGTLSNPAFSTGNVYPAAARPWGMNFWTPQTGKNDDGWIYSYYLGISYKMRGIRQTHQPSPWMGDYGIFSLMPVTNGAAFDQDSRASWFSHKSEVSTPYYYAVYLSEHDTYVECAPTSRAAAFRLSYPEREMSYLVVDCNCDVSEMRMEGRRIYGTSHGISRSQRGEVHKDFINYFVIESDTDFDSTATGLCSGKGAVVGFKTSRGQKVGLKVASSFVSFEQAERNLEELGDGDVDRIRQEGKDEWNRLMGRITVEDDNIDNLRMFYTCLYRSMLFPRDLAERMPDGKIVHRSPYDGKLHEGHLFVDTGFWDTFRSLFALVDWIFPEIAKDVQDGMVNHYLESGFLPEWSNPCHRNCMIGNNSASVVAEAYLKGISSNDRDKLWEALVHGANDYLHGTASGRLGYKEYNSLGYVPCDIGINESAARTLEYAHNDWCIYKYGKAIGRSEEELAPFAERAYNYRNIYSVEDHLMRGRKADGNFVENFNPLKWGGDFTEGNSLQYSWSVLHDPAGLADLMGGNEAFARNIDEIFDMPPIYDESYYKGVIHEIREMEVMNYGNYAHGNQPAQHIAYLYNWCGQPWKSQMRTREIMTRFYSPTPDGYCGDEDNGQTSAWYVFSAMGFYPVCPASCQYAIGSPLFKKVTVSVPGRKPLVISADNNSKDRAYIESISVNGKTSTKNYFTHKQLLAGGKIKFRMSEVPATGRGTAPEDAPYSFSRE
ncbi:MAG: GH92 family glycosyl hydrolase [Bacteroidales bacterium]|nr:GH92 family glycosyl hydrolase [Bacteroidales bacterium]